MNAWEKIDAIMLLAKKAGSIEGLTFSHEYLGLCSDLELDRLLVALKSTARPSTTQMSDNELPKQDLLKKILSQTTNDNDHIALMAIRKANTILKDAGWTWEKLIEGKIRVAENPFANLRKPPGGSGEAGEPPAPPRRPAPPPPRQVWTDLDGKIHYSAQACDLANDAIWARRKAAAKPKPAPSVFPTIGSQFPNKFANHCHCCGNWVDQQHGFIFKPHDILTTQQNPNAYVWGKSKWAVVCKPCNTKQNLTLSHAPAQKIGGPANLADLI